MPRTTVIRLLTASLLFGSLGLAGQPARTQPTSVSTSKLGIVVSQISLSTNDIIYDPVSRKIYASTPGTAGVSGNSIVPIDVPTGTLGVPVFVGSEPNKLAISDDGKYLYVGLDGAAAVRRFNVISHTAELQFSLGSGFCGIFLAEDMVVLKGNSNAVAISLRNSGCSPRHEGVAIYDDGVRRPTSTPGHTGSNVIEPSNSDSTLYGYNNETTEFGFRVMSVISSGVVVTSVTPGIISGFGTDIRFDNGLVYATTGAVINPDTGTLAGTYAGSGLVYPDSSTGRVYFLSADYYGGSVQLKIFDQVTFAPIGSFTISGVSGDLSSLINAGESLLAFRTSGGQVFFVELVELSHSVYLPLIHRPCAIGICGRVTLNGTSAADVSLELRFFDGTSWYTLAPTNTDASGNYAFTSVPSLAPGQRYYVRYRNYSGTPGRLWVWGTRELTSYSAGSNVPLGNFDIADIPLVSPANGATVALPYTFQWTRRIATPSDTYELDLYDPSDGAPYFFTAPPLGYVGTYTLNGLPPGFGPGAHYVWEIWVYSPDGGLGISNETRMVTFSNSGMSATAVGQPVQVKTMPDWEDRRKQ